MQNTKTQRRGRRLSPAEREELLGRYEESGKTQKAFCEEAGISVATLVLWRCKRGSGELIEMAMPAVGVMEIVLPGGLLMRVVAGTALGWVTQVIGSLRWEQVPAFCGSGRCSAALSGRKLPPCPAGCRAHADGEPSLRARR